MPSPFNVIHATGTEVPILISVPHCGIAFPDELKDQYDPALIQAPDDTDWFVDRLYDFAPSLGMTMITSVYSRWVIDLNRDPESKPLYTDGRIITGLCPTTTFLGESLYKDKRTEVDKNEVGRRVNLYYKPYHDRINELIKGLKTRHKRVLLWDCHSIRQFVPTIHKEKFPDLILGSADRSSASPHLIDKALQCLGTSDYSFRHNDPFKGGYITRHFGKPANDEHALQLEMSKVNYMDAGENQYDGMRAEKMRGLLGKTLKSLSDILVES
jgi:N-formylglutamate deformylase